jgi:hypothetical protein
MDNGILANDQAIAAINGKIPSEASASNKLITETGGAAVIKITSSATTLSEAKAMITQARTAGKNQLYDVSALGANASLCTFYVDNADTPTIFKVVDITTGKAISAAYAANTLLTAVLADAHNLVTEEEVSDLKDQINRLIQSEVGDELVVNRVKTLAVTSSSGSLTFSVGDEQKFIRTVGECEPKEYLLVYNGTAWTYEGAAKTDFGITVTGTPTTGEVMHVKVTVEEVPMMLTHLHTGSTLDTNETHPVLDTMEDFFILEEKYVQNGGFNFDAPESAICITPGHTLPAGTYYIYNIPGATGDYWCNYKRLYYVFEVPHDITATESTGDIYLPYNSRGDRETTGDARGVYQLYCKPTIVNTGALYNSDTITFVGQVDAPSNGETDLRTLTDFTTDQSMTSEGIIYNNLGHVCYGNNNYHISNLMQRQNSDAKSMTPVRLHKNDVVTGMNNQKGYLWGLDPRFIEALETAEYSMQYGVDDAFTAGNLHTHQSKAFLLSEKEMSMNIQTNEGIVTALYDAYCDGTLTNAAIAARAKADRAGATPSSYRWSRSAGAGNSGNAWLVSPTGAHDVNVALYGYRFAPAYIIKKSKIDNLGSGASEIQAS